MFIAGRKVGLSYGGLHWEKVTHTLRPRRLSVRVVTHEREAGIIVSISLLIGYKSSRE